MCKVLFTLMLVYLDEFTFLICKQSDRRSIILLKSSNRRLKAAIKEKEKAKKCNNKKE